MPLGLLALVVLGGCSWPQPTPIATASSPSTTVTSTPPPCVPGAPTLTTLVTGSTGDKMVAVATRGNDLLLVSLADPTRPSIVVTCSLEAHWVGIATVLGKRFVYFTLAPFRPPGAYDPVRVDVYRLRVDGGLAERVTTVTAIPRSTIVSTRGDVRYWSDVQTQNEFRESTDTGERGQFIALIGRGESWSPDLTRFCRLNDNDFNQAAVFHADQERVPRVAFTSAGSSPYCAFAPNGALAILNLLPGAQLFALMISGRSIPNISLQRDAAIGGWNSTSDAVLIKDSAGWEWMGLNGDVTPVPIDNVGIEALVSNG